MTIVENAMTLSSWPWLALRWQSDLLETWLGAGHVIAARLPMIGTALSDPLHADHRELGQMVSEKTAAFGASSRAASAAGDKVHSATMLNFGVLNRLALGSLVWPQQWLRLAEHNLAAAAAITTLPGATLAPLHDRVVANARRLTRAA
jgi:hypothetical protein